MTLNSPHAYVNVHQKAGTVAAVDRTPVDIVAYIYRQQAMALAAFKFTTQNAVSLAKCGADIQHAQSAPLCTSRDLFLLLFTIASQPAES